jgi:type I restriction enzyme, S subunit
MKNVSREVIYALPVPLPPAGEQNRIVAKVQQLMTLCDELEAQLTTTRVESGQLLKSVLHHALNDQAAEKHDNQQMAVHV